MRCDGCAVMMRQMCPLKLVLEEPNGSRQRLAPLYVIDDNLCVCVTCVHHSVLMRSTRHNKPGTENAMNECPVVHPVPNVETTDHGFSANSLQKFWSKCYSHSNGSLVDNSKLEAGQLADVPGLLCVSVNVHLGVGVEEARLRAVEDRLHARRIGEPEDAPSASESATIYIQRK